VIRPDRLLRELRGRLELVRLGSQVRWHRIDGGFEMRLDPSDWVDRAFYRGTYDRHLIALIRSIVVEGDACIDVGAQKGFVSLHLADCAGPGGVVVSIEPDPAAAEWLEANCERNFRNIIVERCALSDRAGACTFALSRQLGWSSRFPNALARKAIRGTIEVRTRTLDDVVAERAGALGNRRISFAKIDAEGSELLVIAGAGAVLARHRPVLCVEINRDSLDAAHSTPADLQRELAKAGYRLCRFVPDERCACRYRLEPVRSAGLELPACADVAAFPIEMESAPTAVGVDKPAGLRQVLHPARG
jgi:FkbM family methyltransferase